MEEEFDILEILKMFWNKRIQIMLIILFFMIIGYIYTVYFIQPQYRSESTIILANNNESENYNETLTQSEVMLNDKLVATYRELAKSSSVIEEVIANLRLQDKYTEESLGKKVEVTLVTNTQVIKISATDENPELAANITNEVTKVFSQKVSEVYNINNIKVLSDAEPSNDPSNISLKKNLFMFFGIGFIISIVYVIILNTLDSTIKNKKDIEDITGLNVLAEIPVFDIDKERKK